MDTPTVSCVGPFGVALSQPVEQSKPPPNGRRMLLLKKPASRGHGKPRELISRRGKPRRWRSSVCCAHALTRQWALLQTTAGISGVWHEHTAHPSVNNPQYLLTLPIINSYGGSYADGMGESTLGRHGRFNCLLSGEHTLNIKVARDDNASSQDSCPRC